MPNDLNLKTTEQRIVVVGTSCSGKTTLARQLAATLGIRYIELDALYWRANWQETPLDEFRRQVCRAIEEPAWVVDGNYGKVRELVWSRATTIVWLNYGFLLVLYRAIKRTVTRAFTQEELFAGNRETFKHSFLSKESIILWVLQTHRQRRTRYAELFRQPQYPHLAWIELRRPADATCLLDACIRES